jgi:hypothetical protein
MPKKNKKSIKPTSISTAKMKKADKDFGFLVAVSVFAAMTIFASNYIAQSQQQARAARQTIPVAQLDLASPSPSPSAKTKLKATPRPTPYKYGVPNQK